MLQSGVMKLYRDVKRRMESRYMKKGILPGMLFLVSSKKSEYDFLEQYAKTVKDNPHSFIVDEPVWKVKPSTNYVGTKFQVAVGNKFMPSQIIPEGTPSQGYLDQGYQVINVPTEYKEAFTMDINSALMDIAGIATVSRSKFMDAKRIRSNYNLDRKNPFSSETLTIGIDDDYQIEDFFNLDQIDPRDLSKPGYMHLDLSFSTDRTGISYVVIDGTSKVKRLDKDHNSTTVGTLVDSTDSTYKQIFSVGIQAPASSEMEIGKVRQFIYYLREKGFNIKQISADTFQSKDTLQQLKNAGFNTVIQSLDRTPEGYMTGRTIINENRVDMVDERDSILEKELSEVEQDARQKVDHPVMGSKDIADSFIGSLWLASKSKISLQFKNSSTDAKALTSASFGKDDEATRFQDDLLGGKRVLNNLNDLAGEIDSNGIIDIFSVNYPPLK